MPFNTTQNIFSLVTSHFGEREDPMTGETSFHHGTDFAIPKGTSLLAVVNGVVEEARYHSIYGYTVLISNGIYSFRYAHMSQMYVTKGQMVQGGRL